MQKILLAEDDKNIVKLIKLYLKAENYKILIANDGEEAINIFNENNIDLAILDLMMPKIDGFGVLEEIRKTSNIPILILSAKSTDNDKIIGLNIGADDYITKPFNPLELVARVKAHLRRINKTINNDNLEIQNLKLNVNNCNIEKNGQIINLTAKEFKILHLLMSYPNQIFSKTQILEKIETDYFVSDENAITVHISRLRNKLGKNSNNENYIKTIVGLGYKIEK